MTQAIVTAFIAGICAIVGAVLSALITKHGWAFWRSATVLHGTGTAAELHAIRGAGTIDAEHRGYAYDIRDAVLTIRGDRATFSALLSATDGAARVSDGRVMGHGRVHNGVAFVVYSVSDLNRNQNWTGTMVLRLPGLGKLTGYWLSEDHVEPGIFAFGNIELERA